MEELTAADAGEILTLQRAAYVGEAMLYDQFLPPLFETLEEIRAVLDDPAALVLGIRDQGRLIGTARVKPDGEIARISVAPDRQHEGFGTACSKRRSPAAAPGCSPATAARPTCASTAATASSRPTASRSRATPSST